MIYMHHKNLGKHRNWGKIPYTSTIYLELTTFWDILHQGLVCIFMLLE